MKKTTKAKPKGATIESGFLGKRDIEYLGNIVDEIRAQGSLLQGAAAAAAAAEGFHDWHAVGLSGKMIYDKAEDALEVLDDAEMNTVCGGRYLDNQTKETSNKIQGQGGR